MIRLALALLLCGLPLAAAGAERPANVILQLRDTLWPHRAPETPLPAARPADAPKPPAPVVKAPPAAEKPVVTKPKPASSAARRATPVQKAAVEDCERQQGDCSRMRCYIRKYGYARVLAGARQRGYSDWQISMGRAMCGI